MAKGNLFQGMGRGKVGDVVFTRLDGEQISRVRNRHPKNPKTDKQLLQRAVMATVMQAYSAGKEIFDHSFEGYQVPAGCQRHFLSINAKKLRTIMANDLNNGVAVSQQAGNVVAPGSTTPVPFDGMILSEGTFNMEYILNYKDSGVLLFPQADGEEETLAQYLQKFGFDRNTIITIVLFAASNVPLFSLQNTGDKRASQFDTSFGFVRLKVKESALVSGESALNKRIDSIFDIESRNIEHNWSEDILGDDVMYSMFVNGTKKGVAVGVIYSKEDSGLRSNSILKVSFDNNHYADNVGIASQYALASWKQGTVDLGDSELILEGGDV